ncbi:MAG: DNA lesion error-prone repair protein ImuA [Planctomycetota bacterium]|nr:MAG: DNA lesion error-prone repair protein ImuA [Planctomycetota bacterium]
MAYGESTPPRVAAVRRLSEMLDQAGFRVRPVEREPIPTGCEALDRLLPQGGWLRGSLVEWLSESPAGGAGTLALVAARQAQADGGAVVVIDRTGMFYPPAAAAWRLSLASLIVVHPASEQDEQWALDQALRCEHTAAVLAWPRRIEGRCFRRLQLAAEASGAVGLLVRPPTARREPSWAEVRLAVSPRASPAGWQLCVRLLRCRGRFGKPQGDVIVEIDERTGEIYAAGPRHLAPPLASAAVAAGQA